MNRQLLNKLYQYCFTLTGNGNDAYDLLQCSIEKYLSKKPLGKHNELSYLRKIIKNQFIDDRRKQQNRVHEAFDEVITYVDMDTLSLEQVVASQHQIEGIWQSLKPDEREMLYLWAVEGYSTSELANSLNIPRGTLLSRIHRLRTRLETLNDDGIKQGNR